MSNDTKSINSDKIKNRIVSASWDNTVRVWNPSSGEEEAVLKGHEDYVLSLIHI